MIITKITPSDEAGKREIFIDDAPFCTLSADLVMEFDLHVGQQFAERDLDELICKVEAKRALQKAYTYLSYGAMSRKKLLDKLAHAEFDDAPSQMAADRLEELGLIDDAAYAARLIEVMRTVKRWGEGRVRQELFVRGIPADIIDESLADEFDERDNIRYHLERKYRKRNLSDAAERKKVSAGLARLGFSFDDIRAVINEYASEE